MARQTIGLSGSSIKWEKAESKVSVTDTGEATIDARGSVNASGIGLEQALLLIPESMPVGTDGPIGLSSRLAGAKLGAHGGEWEGGCWIVTASYHKSLSITADYGDGTNRSSNDRAERRIVVVEEPLLTHAVARAFPVKERNLLSNYLRGNIEANPAYEGEGDDEFIWVAQVGDQEVSAPAEFSNVEVTVEGVTASPLDYARLIKGGVTSYQRKSVRHSWQTTRNNEAPASQYRAVGSVVSSPPLAPSVASGFQWLLTGIIDTTENGNSWSTGYEYELSGPGGYLKYLYPGGSGELDQAEA